MSAEVAAAIRQSSAVIGRMAEDPAACAVIAGMAEGALAALRAGGKLLFCGNGGSAADAQHWAAELVARFLKDRPGLPAIALTTDTSLLTAVGNDYGFERVFARQVEALGRPGDVLFAISTSGRSGNVLAALRAARAGGLACFGFCGLAEGEMAPLCDRLLRAPSSVTFRIQEAHEVAGHIICGLIEDGMFPGS